MDPFAFAAWASYGVFAVVMAALIAYAVGRGAAAKRALEAAERDAGRR